MCVRPGMSFHGRCVLHANTGIQRPRTRSTEITRKQTGRGNRKVPLFRWGFRWEGMAQTLSSSPWPHRARESPLPSTHGA
jgi:hypothetical protein